VSFEAIRWAQSTKTGSSSRKTVLFALAQYSDEKNSCYPGQELLAKITELSERAVRRALSDLEKAGLIRREMRRDASGRRTSDRYFLEVPTASDPELRPLATADHQQARMSGSAPSNRPNATEPTGHGVQVIPSGISRVDDEAPARRASIDTIEAEAATARDRVREVGRAVLAIIGVSDDARWIDRISHVQAWLDLRANPESDIYPAVKAVMERRKGDPPNSLQYFDQEIAKRMRAAVCAEARTTSWSPTHVQLTEPPFDITNECCPDAAERWRMIVTRAARRHGHAYIASWFRELQFDGTTIWAPSVFIRDGLLNRFEIDLDGLPVLVRKRDEDAKAKTRASLSGFGG